MIDGVEFKELATQTDERGFFREIIRVTDGFFREGFGQWSHSRMFHGSAKAWHIHRKQVDWWYVMGGRLKVALRDLREESPTKGELMVFMMGDDEKAKVVRIPPGVAHGCKCLSPEAHLFYITSRVYDPADEGRIPCDDPALGVDWRAGAEIK